jgi:hypothetical protein
MASRGTPGISRIRKGELLENIRSQIPMGVSEDRRDRAGGRHHAADESADITGTDLGRNGGLDI